jgi:hypothetical protein
VKAWPLTWRAAMVCCGGALSMAGSLLAGAPDSALGARASSRVPTIVIFDKFSIRPSSIPQGASNSFFALRWTSWGGAMARATGRGTEGVTEHYVVHAYVLDAFRIGQCRGHSVYTRIRVSNLSTHETPFTEQLNCSVGQYVPSHPVGS